MLDNRHQGDQVQHRPLGISPDDVAVSLAVREDLGPAQDPAVIAEFLDRVGAAIDERVDARVVERSAPATRTREFPVLPIASLGFGIPITAIASGQGMGALLIAWGGIAAVNIADALRR